MRLTVVCLLALALAGEAKTENASQPPEDLFRQVAETKSATPEETARLLKWLRSRNQETISNATLALRTLGQPTPETLNALARNFDDPTSTEATRSVSGFALMTLGEPGQAILRDRAQNAPTLKIRLAAITALRANLAGLKDPSLRKEMQTIFQEIEKAANPAPFPPAENSPLSDGGFLSRDWEQDWIYSESGGGKGKVSYDAAQSRGEGGSLRLDKINADGEISLRSVRPLLVKTGETPVIRLNFRSDNAPMTSGLQILLETEGGRATMGASPRGWGALSQTLLRNAPPGQWNKRFIQAPKAENDRFYYIRILMRGNPATVWIDDIGAPAPDFAHAQTVPTETLRETENTPAATQPSTAELRKIGDRTRLVVNGEIVPPILYMILRSSFGDYAGMEQLARIKLLVSSVPFSDLVDDRYPPVHPVWQKSGQFDFTTPLRWLEDASKKAPESNFVLNLHFCWPQDWVEQNPGEAWLDHSGRRAYGTGIHMKGFAEKLPSGRDERLPDVGEAGFRWWPSPFSEKALQDAEEGLRQFVEILKTKPYANRVVGIHVSGGHDYQFMTASWPDYSPAAIAAFRIWLAKRYGSDSELQKSWADPSATLSTVAIPEYEKLAGLVEKKGELFLEPSVSRRYVDHQQFQAEQGLIIRERLAAAFKKYWGRPAFAMTWQMGGGRGQGVENVMLPSPALDMIVAQPYYGLRLPGQVGGLRSTALASFARHGKLAIKELDMRTWLRMSGAEVQSQYLGAAMNPLEFRQIFRREAAQIIATGQGYWFFDIATSAFRDPEILETIAEGDRAYRELEIENPTPIRPDVALVWVDESPYWMADFMKETSKALGGSSVNALQTFERFTSSALKQSGVPYDDIYLSDLLKEPDAAKYKVLVFPDAFRLTDHQRRQIRETFQTGNRTLVWNYAAGYVTDDQLSDAAVSEITGMSVKSEVVKLFPRVRFPEKPTDPLAQGLQGVTGTGEMALTVMSEGIPDWKLPRGFRRFVIEDAEATSLASYGDGKSAVAVKRFPDWTSVYFGMLGTLDAGLFNRIARQAGAMVLADSPVAVEFNGRFLSLHGLTNDSVKVTLPFSGRVYDFDSSEEIGSGTDITVKLKSGDTRWFRVEKQ